jgi:hypothetical protein
MAYPDNPEVVSSYSFQIYDPDPDQNGLKRLFHENFIAKNLIWAPFFQTH